MRGRRPILFIITILIIPVKLYSIEGRSCLADEGVCYYYENPNLISVVKNFKQSPHVQSRNNFFFADGEPVNRDHIMKNINYGYLDLEGDRAIHSLDDLLDMSSEEIGCAGKAPQISTAKVSVPWKVNEFSGHCGGPKIFPDIVLVSEDPDYERGTVALTEKERQLGRTVVQDQPVITDTMQREMLLTKETEDMRDADIEGKYLMEPPRGYHQPPSIVLSKVISASDKPQSTYLNEYYKHILAPTGQTKDESLSADEHISTSYHQKQESFSQQKPIPGKYNTVKSDDLNSTPEVVYPIHQPPHPQSNIFTQGEIQPNNIKKIETDNSAPQTSQMYHPNPYITQIIAPTSSHMGVSNTNNEAKSVLAEESRPVTQAKLQINAEEMLHHFKEIPQKQEVHEEELQVDKSLLSPNSYKESKMEEPTLERPKTSKSRKVILNSDFAVEENPTNQELVTLIFQSNAEQMEEKENKKKTKKRKRRRKKKKSKSENKEETVEQDDQNSEKEESKLKQEDDDELDQEDDNKQKEPPKIANRVEDSMNNLLGGILSVM